MSTTRCTTCGNNHNWNWEEAFDKFGFGDGDGLVMTEHVANALRYHGYAVTVEPWGCHNITIASIQLGSIEQIPDTAPVGYGNPREYLPPVIVQLLDEAFTAGMEVEL